MSIRFVAASIAPLLLAACASPAQDAEPTPALPQQAQCNADAAQGYVGKTADAATTEAARKAAGAGVARTLSPGQMVTMEYRGDRLNLHIDEDRKITRILCG